ncbi:MAG: dihydroorotase [Gammaproteobacteria bacterium]|nr:dihydroorotase [Gammaproteobacteria bacterium]
MKLIIKNGHVIDPANNIDAKHDVYIADGKILSVGKMPAGFDAEKTIDAKGKIVCPGLVDLCARMREPGQEHKATIKSETLAAASNGITTLCCPPDTQPVIDTQAVFESIYDRAEHYGYAQILPLGALTQGLDGSRLSEMAALKEVGCTGVSNAMHPIENMVIMRRAMEYAATFDLTVFIQPEDPVLRDGGTAHEGELSTRLGLRGIPQAAETVAVATYIALAAETGVRVHFNHLSTARAVQMVGRAIHDGHPISADVTAHHLFLTEMELGDYNTNGFVEPPLRSQRDRDGLRDGIAKGAIAAICSDHQPHELDAKLTPFALAEPGISSLDTLLPLGLRLVDEGVMTLSNMLASITCKPAQILNIDAGTLSEGGQADVCIFDPNKSWQLNAETMTSRGKNSPFIGWEFKGKVTHTLHKGRLVFGE